MALRDDVVQKESYYMREMKYLKRMLDEIEKGENIKGNQYAGTVGSVESDSFVHGAKTGIFVGRNT